MPKYVYRVSHYIKGSQFKCDSVIHIIASNLDKVMLTLKANNFSSEGITSISRSEEVKEGTKFD